MAAKSVVAGLVASWRARTEPRLQALAMAAVAWESTSHLMFGVALEAARSALGGRR